jgi:uncharacterized tellurite resistance protein B-like protein
MSVHVDPEYAISAQENHLMRRLVDLLHISHGDNIAAKMRVKPEGFE